jgi:hypothetical protein
MLPFGVRTFLWREILASDRLPLVGEDTIERDGDPGGAFNVRRSTFNVRRSTFNVRRSTFNVRRGAVSVRPGSFSLSNRTIELVLVVVLALGFFCWRAQAVESRRFRRSPLAVHCSACLEWASYVSKLMATGLPCAANHQYSDETGEICVSLPVRFPRVFRRDC